MNIWNFREKHKYFVIREKYTPYVYHGEQEQGMEPMCVNVHCIRDFDDGDSWRWSMLVMSSPQYSLSLMQLTLAETWSVFLAKTQTCLSYWYVVCIGRRWSVRCRWSGAIWQCCAAESAVAWHARLRQLQHDLTSICQSQEQCSKYIVHWRFPRIMHWGNGDDAGGCDGAIIHLFSSHCKVSHRRHPWSLPASHFIKKKKTP